MTAPFDHYLSDTDAFEATVLAQSASTPAHYDDDYFAADWREGDNRYELESRRRIEDRNPALIKEVFQPERVLDVGCGPGFLMLFLHEFGVSVDGVDFAQSSLTLAPDEIRDRISIGPTEPLEAADRSYDLVVCREVWST